MIWDQECIKHTAAFSGKWKYKIQKEIHMKKILLFCCALLPAFGQVVTPYDEETLQTYKYRVKTIWEMRVVRAPSRKGSDVPQAIAAQATATAGNAAWADRANRALTDYLPLFQFAVNAVDTNAEQDAITINFNPVRNGRFGVIQLQATVAKPEVSTELLDLFPEPSRAEQETAIASQLGDLSDLTASMTYGYQRTAGNKTWRDVGHLWGRDYAIYENLVNSLHALALHQATRENRDQASQALITAENQLITTHGTIHELKMSDIAQMFPNNEQTWLDYLTLIDKFYKAEVAFDRDLAEARLADLPGLINNQPQLNFSLSYHKREHLSGQSGLAAGLTYEHGFRNINRVVRKHQAGADLLTAFKEVAGQDNSQDRLTFGLTYKQLNVLDFDYTYAQSETEQAVHFMAEPYEEWQAALAWSRTLTQIIPVGDGQIPPRLVLSAEYTANNNPMLQNRLLASLAYVLPISAGASLPLTLVYANQGRYLGEVDKQFTAHLGLNYKFGRSNP